MLDVFNKYRQSDGIVNLKDVTSLTEVKSIIDGTNKRYKKWLNMDSDLYLFKEGSHFESIKELVNEEMAIQYEIENAEYDLAFYKDKKGVITKDFRENKEFIPFVFIEEMKKSYDFITLCNSLEKKGLSKEQILSLSNIVFKNHLLNIFTEESDRNITNQAFLYNGNDYELAPRYDSSNSFLPLKSKSKMNKFCNTNGGDIFKKYRVAYPKFILYPTTKNRNAINALLDLKYLKVIDDNLYLKEALKILDSEIDKIYKIDMKSIFTKLEFYNINIETYFKDFLECVFEVKKEEYEKKDKQYSLVK